MTSIRYRTNKKFNRNNETIKEELEYPYPAAEKRNLFAKKNEEEVIQNIKSHEVQEEKLSKNNKEDPRRIRRLALSNHY